MQQAYHYLIASGVLTALMWVPYILARIATWGFGDFVKNYTSNYPVSEPEPPLWAVRAKRAHLNMVETLPAFVAVVVGAMLLGDGGNAAEIGTWSMIFFCARIGHYIIYTLGIPYLRTPSYLVSWAAILMIGTQLA